MGHSRPARDSTHSSHVRSALKAEARSGIGICRDRSGILAFLLLKIWPKGSMKGVALIALSESVGGLLSRLAIWAATSETRQ
jgi:hypothetical protein